jgi:hypothetical protein
MGDVAILVLILCVFYLHDCSLWLELDTVAFFAGWMDGWRPTRPHPLLSGSAKGLLLSFRLPPLGPVYLCYPWRAALSPTDVCPVRPSGTVEESSTQPARQALSYDAITSVTVADHTVKVNGQPFVTCQEAHRATALAQVLRHLAGLPASARPQAIRDILAAGMNPDRLRSDMTILAKTARLLRILCNTLFVYLFLVVPALLASFGLSRLWPILVSVLGVLVLVIAVEFRDIHAWLWPVEKGARRSALSRIGFYPPTAIRAHEYLAHRLCAGHHPLAVAYLICAPSVFHRFARQVVRQLHYPLAGSAPNPTLAATEQWFRSAQEEAIRRTLAACGLDLDALLRPPPRTGEGSLAYCPRCDTEYTVTGGTCADCPGVMLIPYDQANIPRTVMNSATAQAIS